MFPQKLHSGQKFKPIVVQRINDIIDYLRTQKIIVDGKTLKADQLSSGLALTAIPNNQQYVSMGGKGGGISTPSQGIYMLVCINGTITWLEIPTDSTYVLTSKEIPSSSSSDSSSSLGSSSSYSSSSITPSMPQYYLEWVEADECDIQCPDDTIIEQQDVPYDGQ